MLALMIHLQWGRCSTTLSLRTAQAAPNGMHPTIRYSDACTVAYLRVAGCWRTDLSTWRCFSANQSAKAVLMHHNLSTSEESVMSTRNVPSRFFRSTL